MPYPRLRVAGVALVAALLSACGGGGGGGSGSSNDAPLADAGAAQSAFKNSTVTLSGSGSTDADGDSLSYAWTQTAGPAVVLSSAGSPSPSFTAPGAAGNLQFSLVVNDGQEDSSPDTVTVTVQNRLPVAAAGTNVSVPTATLVTLDGRTSSDPDGDGLAHTWVQKSGPVVTLTDNGNGTARFTTPGVHAILEFTLTVADGDGSTEDDVVVVVQQQGSGNLTPVADAGDPQTVPRRSEVWLSGYGYDPDWSGVTSYSWQQSGGPPVVLIESASAFPRFTAPETAGDLEFTLVVSDGQLDSPPATVQIQVRNYAPYVQQLELTPDGPGTLDDLTVEAVVVDPDQDPVTVTYSWTRNGSAIGGATGALLPDDQHVKNDSITARIEASDGVESIADEINVIIQDTPAVITGTAPAEIDHGETMSFRVEVSDPDGDQAGDLQVDYGPAGMAVDDDGDVSWTADGPLFERATDFNWRVSLAGQPAAGLQGTVTVNDADRLYPLRRSGIEIPVYHSGLVISDLDGDGDGEMLVGSHASVYELAKQGTGYAQAWMYPFAAGNAAGVTAVAAADLDEDDKQEIFFAAGDEVVRLGGVDRREVARHDSAGDFHCRDLELADVDLDGNLELVCLGNDDDYGWNDTGTIVVFDAATLAIEWQSPNLTVGRALALGNVDADPAIEIVTAKGHVYDGITRANQWAYGPGFGMLVDTGDLDGDGVEEIVGVDDWNAFRGFSAVLRSPLWQGTGSDFDAILVTNVDADPQAEVVIGDGQWGNVTAWNYVPATNSVAQAWQINSQDHGVTSIAAGNVDGDGAQEIVWGSGASSSGEDVFVVAGRNPGISIEWKNGNPNELDGPFVGARLARVSPSDSLLLFQSASSDNGYGGTRLVGLDPVTGLLEVSGELGSNWAGVGALDAADYDLDGIDEALLATANLYDGYFAVADFRAGGTEWTSTQGDATGAAVTHADLTGDGAPELVGMTGAGSVEVHDVLHQSLVWKGTSIQGGGRDVAVADLNGDAEAEIIALARNGLVVYRRNAGPVTWVEAASRVLSEGLDLLVADTDGDGTPEIYVLSGYYSGSSILRFDAGLNPAGTLALGQAASSLHLEDQGDDRVNLLVSLIGDSGSASPRLAAVDPETGHVIWRSPALDGDVPINSLSWVDSDLDGEREIAFGTGGSMYLTR